MSVATKLDQLSELNKIDILGLFETGWIQHYDPRVEHQTLEVWIANYQVDEGL